MAYICIQVYCLQQSTSTSCSKTVFVKGKHCKVIDYISVQKVNFHFFLRVDNTGFSVRSFKLYRQCLFFPLPKWEKHRFRVITAERKVGSLLSLLISCHYEERQAENKLFFIYFLAQRSSGRSQIWGLNLFFCKSTLFYIGSGPLAQKELFIFIVIQSYEAN